MNKNILLVTVLLGTIVACKKENTTNTISTPSETAVEKAKKVLMSGNWVMESNAMAIGNGPLIPIPIEDCEKDDYLKFTSTKQIMYFGTEKCELDEPSIDSMSYSFNSKADSITFSDPENTSTFGFSNPSANQIIFNASSENFKQKIVLKRK
jgi:hypothetical protein